MSKPFTVEQTHGILTRPEFEIEASSTALGWSSLFASAQCERPYGNYCAAVDDCFVVVHRDQRPVRVERDINGEKFGHLVLPGGLFIMPGQVAFSVRLFDLLATTHLYIRRIFIAQAASELCRGDPDHARIIPRLGEHDPMIEQIAATAREALRSDMCGDWLAESLARALAVRLVLRHSALVARVPAEPGPLSTRRLRAVDDLIRARLSTSISLTDLAAAAALSPIYFARQFKKATGISPYRYVVRQRVEAAKRLLVADMSLAEIAFACGFAHQEHLSRTFGGMVGMAPGAYRTALRR